MSDTVISLNGGITGERHRSEVAVDYAKRLLEKVEAGEVMGFAVAELYHDGTGGYKIVGRVGGFSMLGAVTALSAEMSDIARNGE